MKQLRFYYCDERGHIVWAGNRPCEDEAEAKALARQVLTSGEDGIHAVEVWEETTILHRVRREDLTTK